MAMLFSERARRCITDSSLFLFAKLYFSQSDIGGNLEKKDLITEPTDIDSTDSGKKIDSDQSALYKPKVSDESVDYAEVQGPTNWAIQTLESKQPLLSPTDQSPEMALQDFVNALKRRDIGKASSNWPDFPQEFWCDAVGELIIRKSEIFRKTEKMAVGYVELSCKHEGKIAVFSSCMDITPRKNGWSINSACCDGEEHLKKGNGEGALRTVEDFYGAVKAGDCGRASELRPGFTEELCRSTTRVDLHGVRVKYMDDALAVVYIDLTYNRGGKAEQFSGYLVVDRVVSGWKVNGRTYRILDEAGGLERYLMNVAGRKLGVEKAPPAGVLVPTADLGEAELLINGLFFGSQAVLRSCWTQSALKGEPAEKRIMRIKTPQKSGPSTLRPHHWVPPLFPAEQNSIRSVTTFNNKLYIALTFDLCERSNEIAGYDAEIVDYLRANRVKATFFAGGKWMSSHKERAMQLMADPLFEVGNHSWSHANLRVIDHREIENQILWAQAQYESLWQELKERSRADPEEMMKIPRLPMVFRFPYGTCNAESLRLLARYGLTSIQWDIVSGDAAKAQTAEKIAQIVLKQAKPGSIVIFHGNGRGHGTAESLLVIVRELRKRGYHFVTVSELLRLGRINSTEDCFELKPNDNLHYDRIFDREG